MYDTVHLWLEGGQSSGLSDRLDRISERTSLETGETYFSGEADNMRILVNGRGVSIKGSLCKFLYGDNVRGLTREQVQQSVEKLSDVLGYSVNHAKVSRLDIGACFTVDEPPFHYLEALGRAPHFDRSENHKRNGDGLYYTNGLRQMLFYDKAKELKSKRQCLPSLQKGKHLLRYELRFLQRVARQFKRSSLEAETLYNGSFFAEAVRRWEQAYFTVQRRNVPRVAVDVITGGVKTAIDAFALSWLLQHNNFEIIGKEITEARRTGLIDKIQASRLRAKLQSLSNSPALVTPSTSITELDEKVRSVATPVLR